MGKGYRRSPVLFDGLIDMHLGTLRMLTAFSLAAFPLGALLEALSGGSLGEIVGNLLGAGALFAMFAVLGARPSRLVGGDSVGLDEFELSVRHKAVTASYQVLAALVLGGAAYLYFALEFGGPLPADGETWQALTTYAILVTFVLPSTLLAWAYGDDVADSDVDAEKAAA